MTEEQLHPLQTFSTVMLPKTSIHPPSWAEIHVKMWGRTRMIKARRGGILGEGGSNEPLPPGRMRWFCQYTMQVAKSCYC